MQLLGFMEVAGEDDISWTKNVLEGLLEKAKNVCSVYGGRIIIALLFILVGFKLIKFFVKFLKKIFSHQNMDPSVKSFLVSLVNIALKIVVLLTAITIVGIQVTSFLTLLGSAGIAIGLALQGSLANLAGGVLILMLKPYKVEDYIKTSSGEEGIVVSIDIFYTKLRSIDNQIIVIPNGELSNSSITNVTRAEHRRVDLEVDIAYSADIRQAKKVLGEVIHKEKRVVSEKDIDIFVSNLGDSGITMGVHIWVHTKDYWPVRWKMLEDIKYAFDEAGIEIPYQTIDINVNGKNLAVKD